MDKKILNLIKKEGEFTLTNGSKSNVFYDCSELLKDSNLIYNLIMDLNYKILLNIKDIDIIVSPAIGGIIFGYELAVHRDLGFIFSEKINGKLTIGRSFKIEKDKNYFIMEDVITTGGTSLETINLIKEQGGNIVGIGCVVNRSGKTRLKGCDIISYIEEPKSHA